MGPEACQAIAGPAHRHSQPVKVADMLLLMLKGCMQVEAMTAVLIENTSGPLWRCLVVWGAFVLSEMPSCTGLIHLSFYSKHNSAILAHGSGILLGTLAYCLMIHCSACKKHYDCVRHVKFTPCSVIAFEHSKFRMFSNIGKKAWRMVNKCPCNLCAVWQLLESRTLADRFCHRPQSG